MAADPIVKISARPVPQEPMVPTPTTILFQSLIGSCFLVHYFEPGHLQKVWRRRPGAPYLPNRHAR